MVSQLGSMIKDIYGSYDYAYILAAVMLVLGTGLMIFLSTLKQTRIQQSC